MVGQTGSCSPLKTNSINFYNLGNKLNDELKDDLNGDSNYDTNDDTKLDHSICNTLGKLNQFKSRVILKYQVSMQICRI